MAAAASVGAEISALDMIESTHESVVVDITGNTRLREGLDIPVFHDDQHIGACDRSAIHRGETYGDDHRQWIADNTNPDSFAGSLDEALLGVDVFIGVSAPSRFRGLLDAAARHVTTPMLVPAAEAIANCVSADELNASYTVSSVFDSCVAPAVAEAVVASASGHAH